MNVYNNWKVDNKASQSAIEKSRAVISKYILGDLYSVESSDNEILLLLDKYAGIDLVVLKDGNIKGVASRVQWGHNWDTFTIRSKRHTGTKTEYEKRVDAINNGHLYPALTMQIYCNNRENNDIQSMGIMKTIDLYELLDIKKELFKVRESDNVFHFIKWIDIKEQTDKKILIYNKQGTLFAAK